MTAEKPLVIVCDDEKGNVRSFEIRDASFKKLYKLLEPEARHAFYHPDWNSLTFHREFCKRHDITDKFHKDAVHVFINSIVLEEIETIMEKFVDIGILIKMSDEDMMMHWFETNRIMK